MKLVPYLNFAGNAEEALNFYKTVLDGNIEMLSRYGDAPMPCEDADKQRVMHARLVFGNNMIMMSDMPGTYPASPSGCISLSIDMEDPAAMEKAFNQMAEGGTVTMPLADQFWGAKFGMLKDKFDISWMFSCELKK